MKDKVTKIGPPRSTEDRLTLFHLEILRHARVSTLPLNNAPHCSLYTRQLVERGFLKMVNDEIHITRDGDVLGGLIQKVLSETLRRETSKIIAMAELL